MTPELLAWVMEETWPPAARHAAGPFILRDGRGGGKRVSAATADANWTGADLAPAEAAMRDLGQPPLFLIRAGDEALDAALAAGGYAVVDPVVAYAAPVARLADPPPALSAFPHWPPLAATAAIWTEGGIGPARLAVMDRVAGARTAILARLDDRCAGAGFVAISGETAMIHALEVAPAFRRRGAARHILRAAACWAQDNGAATFSLVVTSANAPALALYASLGMEVVGQYHYRQKA
ncbi:MAG: GNAT family N-acetyltransferase [Paracoccaceae bacterium]